MTVVQTGRPSHGSLTRRVWEIADDMLRESGALPRGRDVVDRYLEEDPGRSEGTGFTQYSHWKKALQERRANSAAQGADTVLRLDETGAVRLPPHVIEEMGLTPNDRFVLTRDGDSIRLEPAGSALARARALVKEFDSGKGSPVDELIAERRREGGA